MWEEPDEPRDCGAALPYQPRRNIVRIELAPDVSVSLAHINRNFYTTSSCGICGKASLLALQTVCPPRVENNFRLDANVLYPTAELPSRSSGDIRSHRCSTRREYRQLWLSRRTH